MPAPGTSPSTERTVTINSAATTIADGDFYLSSGDYAAAQDAYQIAGAQLAPLSTSIAAEGLALAKLGPPLSLGDAVRAQSMAKDMLSQVIAQTPGSETSSAGTAAKVVAVALAVALLGGAGYWIWRAKA